MPAVTATRRDLVLASALDTFARYGYQKTSMEDVARAASISRPGLYLLFGTKQELFAAAVTQALDLGLTGAVQALADPARPLRERLLGAFDQWTGRYVGALSREVSSMAQEYRELLGDAVDDYPRRFAGLLESALAGSPGSLVRHPPTAVAQTLIAASIGIKHQVSTRDVFLERLAVAVDLVVGGDDRDHGQVAGGQHAAVDREGDAVDPAGPVAG